MVLGPGMAASALTIVGRIHLVVSLPAGIGRLDVKILLMTGNYHIIPPVLTA